MYRAVIGSFASQEAAQSAISHLREEGFPGEHMALFVRDALGEGDVADTTLPGTGNGIIIVLAILLGVIGLLVGLAVGYTTNRAATTAAGGGLSTGIAPYALIGVGIGLIVGLIAGFLIAVAARQAEARWSRAYGRRGEVLLAVATDAGNVPRARRVLADQGAYEVRRGGMSEAEEFVLRAAPIQPEAYDARPVVIGSSEGTATPPALTTPADSQPAAEPAPPAVQPESKEES